jgi:hypothetical protein
MFCTAVKDGLLFGGRTQIRKNAKCRGRYTELRRRHRAAGDRSSMQNQELYVSFVQDQLGKDIKRNGMGWTCSKNGD